MLELCEILGITANELLSGERITTMEEYRKKAEQNMVDLQEKAQARKSIFRVNLIGSVITALLILAHLAISFYFPDNHGTGIGELVLLTAFIMLAFTRHYENKHK